jgi:hypothetical protein
MYNIPYVIIIVLLQLLIMFTDDCSANVQTLSQKEFWDYIIYFTHKDARISP